MELFPGDQDQRFYYKFTYAVLPKNAFAFLGLV